MKTVRKVLAWAQRNERHLGGIVFFFGFLTDLLTFTLLDISILNYVFGGYLVATYIAVFLVHLVSKEVAHPSVFRRSVRVLLPLVAQYLIANMLSGFLIFYTKSSVLFVSWPFIILLGLVFIGNEWFRTYKDRLIFLATLLFFTTYAYAIFALPLFVHRLGPAIFLASTALSIAVFAAFLFLLWRTGPRRLQGSLLPTIGTSLAVLIVMMTSYFTGLIPPIPLTLKDSGVYHSLIREGGNYVVLAEKGKEWWDPRAQILHTVSGEQVYAYSSVFAPIQFGASIVHRWEYFDPKVQKWVSRGNTSFPITGGRSNGYRGYSERTLTEMGSWRVRVETANGQTIGQILFTAKEVSALPPLKREVR
ncbi:DUF2914 domain-containing protein [Patescibacteria group bacterium]|nr:DUF2914 domain-containing protein [Patescibacteria group bacterium]MBU1500759.1 DUF2914 domain-containing protein [Patescibacteria group bacterium]MBU2080814.1 DUF2914 domain-containing protein [Patescibacteria group bacterium]MBU2123919.1 DUF2914 domain-containing protein [Patescibacteria group bacterium]MBU2194790.1 DUF2914 domain-containing protein [Patescibacteria group bacterium]